MSKNLTKKIIIISIISVMIFSLFSNNVFAYYTKNTTSGVNRTIAINDMPKNTTNIEISGVSVSLNNNSECIVNVIFKETIPKHSKNLILTKDVYYPHFLISVPLQPAYEYPSRMNTFVSKTHNNKPRTEVMKNSNGKAQTYLEKVVTFNKTYSIKMPKDVSKDLCIDNPVGKLDIYVFIPNTSGGGLYNSVYHHMKPDNKNISYKIWHSDLRDGKTHLYKIGLFGNIYKPTDSTGRYVVDYLYNADYAYGVDISGLNTPKSEEGKYSCKKLNDAYGKDGYCYVPTTEGYFRPYLYNYDYGYTCISNLPTNKNKFIVHNPEYLDLKTMNAELGSKLEVTFTELKYIGDWSTLNDSKSYPTKIIEKMKKDIADCKVNKATTSKQTPIPKAPTNLDCSSCPGYEKSKSYPSSQTINGKNYTPGSICYKCNENDLTKVSRCDPSTGNLLGDKEMPQALLKEICPELLESVGLDEETLNKLTKEIEDSLADLIEEDLKKLTASEIELPGPITEIVNFGEIQSTVRTVFLCDYNNITTLEKRLGLTYNNDNANYLFEKNEKSYFSTNYISENQVNINIDPKLFKSANFFKEVNDYANICFIGDFDILELNDSKYYIKSKEIFKFTNGEVISTLKILDNKKIEICINRPTRTLTDTEKIIDNKVYLDSDLKKEAVLKIKKSNKFWFDKTVKEIKISLSTELSPMGCADKDNSLNIEEGYHEEKTPEKAPTTYNFSDGSCYNPKETQKTGLTGEDNFLKYGFDKFSFIYDEEVIPHSEFDYGNYYADQDQLKVALYKKAKIIEKKQTIILEGITFRKTEDNKVAENWILRSSDMLANTSKNTNLDGFVYSDNPEDYLKTLTIVFDSMPKELTQFILIDVNFNTRNYPQYNSVLTTEKITEKINKLSGNENHKYLSEKSTTPKPDNTEYDIHYYQMTVETFVKNQKTFREYILSKPNDESFKRENILFMQQFMESLFMSYGDAVSHALINTKPFGSLDSGLTKKIFTEVKFMSEVDKPIELDKDSEVKEINSPGLYMFEIKVDNKGKYSYSVKETTHSIRTYFDYYNLSNYKSAKDNPYGSYKENPLFTNPINAMYFEYSKIPFYINYQKTKFGEKFKNAFVYEDYTNWSEIQNGYIFSLETNDKGIEKMVFKDIRPIKINSSQDYTYKYLKPNNTYSDNITKKSDKDTIFVFLNNDNKNPQLVLTSNNELSLNWTVVPEVKDGKYIYNIPSSIKSKNKPAYIDQDMFSGIETNRIGFTLALISLDKMCFNISNNKLDVWLNPEYAEKVSE